jgi:hypothetical protein
MPSEQPVVDVSRVTTIPIPLTEWERMNRQIGFWEGVWSTIKDDHLSDATITVIEKRYEQISGKGMNS